MAELGGEQDVPGDSRWGHEASNPPEPSPLLGIHVRLLKGDATADEDLAQSLLGWLHRRLTRRYPWVDPEFVHDGIIDAFDGYCKRPGIFDVRAGIGLEHFLESIARRNLAHLIRGESRRKNSEEKAAKDFCRKFVELRGRAGYLPVNDATQISKTLDDLAAGLDDTHDAELLELMRDGVKLTDRFAETMGIGDLAAKVKTKRVKQAKDRLMKKLQRCAAKLGLRKVA
jgi:DNA-directed RNA polymerase specialized sigma24 family protein